MLRGFAGLMLVASLTGQGFAADQPRPLPRLAAARNLMQAALPAETVIKRDIPYVENGVERQRLDLYLLPKSDKPRPMMVWVHGGGWKSGNKERTPIVGVLQDGIHGASLNYRYSQEAPFPAQIQDCQAAIRWLKAHAEEYGIDPDRIGVWGASAGGHLVSMLGMASDSTDWEAIGEHREISPRVRCVIDWFGPADLTMMGVRMVEGNEALNLLIRPTEGDLQNKLRIASPVSYATKDDAPFMILQGDQDPLVALRQSELLRDALQKVEVPVELIVLKGAGHGGPEFLNEANREAMRAFARKHLLDEQTKPVVGK